MSHRMTTKNIETNMPLCSRQLKRIHLTRKKIKKLCQFFRYKVHNFHRYDYTIQVITCSNAEKLQIRRS